MKHGDIVWVNLPGMGGHEQSGRRPAIVVQDEAETQDTSTIVIIPLTSKLGALRFPRAFRIEPSDDNQLSKPSIALVHQITVVDLMRIDAESGRLSAEDYQRVEQAITNMITSGA
jgi:mRNA interferase MazF